MSREEEGNGHPGANLTDSRSIWRGRQGDLNIAPKPRLRLECRLLDRDRARKVCGKH